MINKKVDLSKKGKPTGWRFKGKKKKLGSRYFQRPERLYTDKGFDRAKREGLIYYEPRLSKGDINQRMHFAKGGLVSTLTKKYSLADIFGF